MPPPTQPVGNLSNQKGSNVEPEKITSMYEELGADLVDIGNEILSNIKNYKAGGTEAPLIMLQGTLAILCHSHVLTMQQCSRSAGEVYRAGLLLMGPMASQQDRQDLGTNLQGCSASTMRLLSNLQSALTHAMDAAEAKAQEPDGIIKMREFSSMQEAMDFVRSITTGNDSKLN
jgi:hypothetical protein